MTEKFDIFTDGYLKELDLEKVQKENKEIRSLINMFDIDFLNDMHHQKNMKTYLKKTRNKGLGVYAKRNIKKGETVCYYLVWVHIRNSQKKFNTNYKIGFRENRGIVGDIESSSLQFPTGSGIAYYGYLMNEPSMNQKTNCVLHPGYNKKQVKDLKVGDGYLYKLIAIKNIKKNEELTWYYGDFYQRNYKTSGKSKSK